MIAEYSTNLNSAKLGHVLKEFHHRVVWGNNISGRSEKESIENTSEVPL